MIIPHLLFAHMLADYVLQSNWMVARKGKSWEGLALHGGIVGFMSLLAVSPYLEVIWPGLLVLTVLHTFQDYLKVRYGPRLHVHAFIPYMGDQILHYLTIIGVQLWVGDRLHPGDYEVAFMWIATAVVVVTRFYDVTWWANWLDMIPYMKRWQSFAFVERTAMLSLTAGGLWFIAPACVVPRLVAAQREGKPIWEQRRGALEMGLGIVLSLALGIGLNSVLTSL